MSEYNHDFEMLEGHSILYFGPEEWDGMWRNRHQLMSRFSRKNRVMYIEPVYSIHRLRRRIQSGGYGISEIWRDLRRGRVSEERKNLFIYHSPFYMPIIGRFPLDKISRWLWNFLLKKSLKSYGFSKPIIWLSRPNMSSFTGIFDEKLIIYHVVDEYLAYGEKNIKRRTRSEMMEEQLLKKADIVIVVSDNLYNSKSLHNKNTFIVPNGVDYLSYDKVLTADGPPPPDISTLPKPVIGYSGLISQRLDLELIAQIAQKYPGCSLVLLGQVSDVGCVSELKKLEKIGNVFFLGSKTIDQVPSYVKEFDICIVPYKLNEETKNLSPLKLYDFMAMGKKIVTTDFPAAREFKDVVRIAESPDIFLNCIKESLVEEDQHLYKRRRRIASRNTWEDRVERISEIVLSHL